MAPFVEDVPLQTASRQGRHKRISLAEQQAGQMLREFRGMGQISSRLIGYAETCMEGGCYAMNVLQIRWQVFLLGELAQ